MKLKLAIATLSFIPALVLAQTAPNLLGTWKGVSNSTVMGIGGHHKAINKKKNENTSLQKNKLELSNNPHGIPIQIYN
jgi:hypothetical protein